MAQSVTAGVARGAGWIPALQNPAWRRHPRAI